MTGPHQIFLLSPASCTGRRARMLLRAGAASPLAASLHAGGAPLADVFSFLSALYFRGKIAYARAFAAPPGEVAGIHVITTSRGLALPTEPLTARDLHEFASVDIGADSPRYLEALYASAGALSGALSGALPGEARVVLLGSIATGKYVDPLREVFGRRLVFPREFVGRGDMSRGGLMLRCAREGTELAYVPVDDVPRRGGRPPRLPPVRRSRTDASGA